MKQSNVKPCSQIWGTKRRSESFILKSFAAAMSINNTVSLEQVLKLTDLFIFENILINL